MTSPTSRSFPIAAVIALVASGVLLVVAPLVAPDIRVLVIDIFGKMKPTDAYAFVAITGALLITVVWLIWGFMDVSAGRHHNFARAIVRLVLVFALGNPYLGVPVAALGGIRDYADAMTGLLIFFSMLFLSVDIFDAVVDLALFAATSERGTAAIHRQFAKFRKEQSGEGVAGTAPVTTSEGEN